MLDAITGAPAAVLNGRLDMLATNTLARGLYSEMYVDPARPVNHARFVFLSPRAPDFYGDWERAADDTVAILRTEAGRDPYDRDLSDLVGELSTRSEEFRTRWAAHNVRIHRTGTKDVPPPGRRRPQPDVRDAGAVRRQRPRRPHVHRRARLEVRRGTRPPRELDRDDRRGRRGRDAGESVVTIRASRAIAKRRGSRARNSALAGLTEMELAGLEPATSCKREVRPGAVYLI